MGKKSKIIIDVKDFDLLVSSCNGNTLWSCCGTMGYIYIFFYKNKMYCEIGKLHAELHTMFSIYGNFYHYLHATCRKKSFKNRENYAEKFECAQVYNKRLNNNGPDSTKVTA